MRRRTVTDGAGLPARPIARRRRGAGHGALLLAVLASVGLPMLLIASSRDAASAPNRQLLVQHTSDDAYYYFNVAANIGALGAQAVLFGLCGRDEAADQLKNLLGERGIDPAGLIESDARPTTIKTRILAHNQQVVRTDREDDRPVDMKIIELLVSRLAELGPFDGFISFFCFFLLRYQGLFFSFFLSFSLSK